MGRVVVVQGAACALILVGCGTDGAGRSTATPSTTIVASTLASATTTSSSSPPTATTSPSSTTSPSPSSSSAPSSSPSAPATTIPTTCPAIREAIQRAEVRHAGRDACTIDADCDCYGGPVCPNTLAQKQCPAPVSSAATAELDPLQEAWNKRKCGDYLWSPSRCEPVCANGRCATKSP